MFGWLGRFFNSIFGFLLAMVGAIWLVSITGVIVYAFRDTRSPASAIVVLGAAQYAGKPSPVLRARLDHAIDLWRSDTTRRLVLTGGTGQGDTTSEALVGSLYAQKQGVPADKILLETEGRTTSASIHAVGDLLQPLGVTRVVLVSDPFHMFRLWILARKTGFEPITSPTRTSPITMRSARNVGYIFSESLKAPIAFLLD